MWRGFAGSTMFNRAGNRVRRLRVLGAPLCRALHSRYKLEAITLFEVGY